MSQDPQTGEASVDAMRTGAPYERNASVMFVDRIRRSPDRTALVTLGEEEISYRDLGTRMAAAVDVLRAHGVTAGDRVAFAAVKRKFEKVGDHWEPKQAKGPSDRQARNPRAGRRPGADLPTAGGVDANATKDHLYKRARQLDVPGRSRMTKDELVDALQKESDRRTSQSG